MMVWRSFLSLPHCYLLNVDWFEPFERGVYSVGAIYFTVQVMSSQNIPVCMEVALSCEQERLCF